MTVRQQTPAMLALLIGVICGVGGNALGLPLPWMLGPMIGTTIAALAHMPIAAPDKLRPVVIPIIGVMLGSAITADILSQLGEWTTTLVILPVFLSCAAAASYSVYRYVGKYDRVTAFYASMPGGLNEMLIMGQEAGGDERRIAMAHAARVLFVILFVAAYFGLFYGVSSGSGTSSWIALNALTVKDYVILGLCALLGIPFGKVARLPAAPVFGPMILSGIAHVVGIVTIAPPTMMVIAAQIVIGTIIGARFIGATIQSVGRDFSLAIMATFLMLVVAVIFAQIIATLIGMPMTQAFLAFSPGGLTEMSLLTLAIGQDIAFVSVTHIVRITLVIAIAPAVFRLILRR